MIEILPLLILFIIYPFIVRMNVFPTPRGSLEYLVHPLGDANGDFYFYEKLKLLIPMAVICLIILLIKREKIRSRYYIGLGIYVAGITVSTLMSPFLSIAVKGGGNRYEGYYALLSYGVLALCLMNVSVEKGRRLRLLIGGLFTGGFLVSIAGITEFFGRSIYKFPFLAEYALPNKEWLDAASYPAGGYTSMIQVIMGNPQYHNVSSTLGNSNYGGSFAALILGVAVVIFLEGKTFKGRILTGLVYSLIFSLLLVSRSRAGMVSLQAGMLLLALLKRREIKRYFKPGILLLALSLGLSAGFNHLSGGAIAAQLTKDEGAGSRYRELVADTSGLKLKMYGGDLNIKATDEGLVFTDEEGKDVPYKISIEGVHLTGEGYEEISLLRDRQYDEVIHLNLGGSSSYPIVMRGDEFKTIGREGLPEEIISPERIAEVDRIQKKGSKRIYIWSRSLPLIKKTGLFGFGPDTYPIVYPQNDYFGKFIAYGTPYMFISKPHNMYLQMGINTGLVSLLGFLMVVIPYVLQSIKLHLTREDDSEEKVMALGVFIGVFSYLVAGLFNDSAVSIAPNFWMMLGLGIALNTYLIRGRKERNVEAMKGRI